MGLLGIVLLYLRVAQKGNAVKDFYLDWNTVICPSEQDDKNQGSWRVSFTH